MPKFKIGQKVKVTRYPVDSSLVSQEGVIDGLRGTMSSGRGTGEGSTGGFLAARGEDLYVVRLQAPPEGKPARISVAESGLEAI